MEWAVQAQLPAGSLIPQIQIGLNINQWQTGLGAKCMVSNRAKSLLLLCSSSYSHQFVSCGCCNNLQTELLNTEIILSWF